MGKAAHFFGLQPVHLNQIKIRTPKEAEKVSARTSCGHQSASKGNPGPQIRQFSVFGQNDMSFANMGIQAFRAIDLEKTVELLQKHAVCSLKATT